MGSNPTANKAVRNILILNALVTEQVYVSVSKIEFCGFDSHQGYMDIKRNIETKYGIVEVDFHFEDGVWTGSTNKDVFAIASNESFDELEMTLVEMYEMGVIFNKVYNNNPHKNKVEKEILKNLFTGDWWKLHKN